MAKTRKSGASAATLRKPRSGAKGSTYDGRVVKLLLEAVGMTQKELARRSGVHPKALSRIVKGEKALTSEIADKLAQELRLPLHAFGEAREFLIQVDHLRAGPSPVGNEGGEAPPADANLNAEEVAEQENRQLAWDRYIEDREVIDSAARTFRDLLLWFLARSGGPPPPRGA